MNRLDWIDEKRYHGTTTLGIATSESIVLATDTRVSSGYLFIAHRNGRKMYKIADHLGMTIAGTVADAQNVVDTLKYNTAMYKLSNKRPMPVAAAARLASNIFFSSRLFPYLAEVLVAGIDSDGCSLYDADLFGSLTKSDFISTGSGSPVAYGILETEYKKSLSTHETLQIAVRAVSAAMKRNAGTGDSFDVGIIDKAGFMELSVEEKTRILREVNGE